MGHLRKGALEEMKKAMVWLLCAVFLTGITACQNNNKKGAAYPQKEITMIIPYGAGGTTDVTGRQFALALEKQLGKSIVIVNQSGASGSVGTKTVLDAKPDGYTILYTADSLGTQRVMGISEYSYDDFSPIMAVVNDPKVIVVNKNSKYNSLEDLIKDMKDRPGKVKMSYTGPGGSGHVQALIYNQLGLNMALTAYGSGAECMTAVLSNQVDFTNANYSTVNAYLASGELKLLGVSAKERLTQYPDVPALPEVMPEAEQYLSMPFTPLSLVVAKDCPEEVKETLRQAAKKAVLDSKWQEFVKQNSLEELYVEYPEIKDIEQFYQKWESVVCWLLWDAGVAKNNPEQYQIPRP